MAHPRIPIDPAAVRGGRVAIAGGDARHLRKALRLGAGDRLVAFDGTGREWDATIERVEPSAVHLALGEERRSAVESPCEILLGQGVGKGDKLDLVVRAATELGVRAVVPVVTERAVATAAGDARLERWRRIAAEACKQCGRAAVPEIARPEPLEAFLRRAARFERKLVPWESGGVPLRSLAGSGGVRSTALLVGPEGGLAPREVAAAEAAGFVAVRLGPRVLRTETAGIVAVAAAQLLFGDLT